MMTRNDVIDLLTLMASFDRRTVGKADVAAWLLVVGDLDAGDTQVAVVEHYRDSRDWAMPADIRRRVKAVRAERLRDTPLPIPPREISDGPGEGYRAWIAAERELIASGGTRIALDVAR